MGSELAGTALTLDSLKSFILFLGLVMARLVPILTLCPVFGGKTMPRNVKVGFSVLLALLLYTPLTSAMAQPIPDDSGALLLLVLKETVFGTAIGFVSSLVFYAIQTAGRLIDLARGSGMASMLAPQTEGQVSPLGELQFQFAIAFFFLFNGHHLFLKAIFKSFEIVPLESFPDFGRVAPGMFTFLPLATGQVIAIGVLLSAPPLIVCFLTDVAFGIINRVAPHVNSFFMSAPVKGMLGVLMLLFILGLLVVQMKGSFAGMLRDVQRVVRMF